MVLLSCAIIGEGSVISIIIEEWKTVALLKKAIKDESEDITIPWKNLQLFLAKKDGAWMRSNDPDAINMRSGAIPERVEELLHEEIDPTEEIGDLFGGVPTKKTIHVLVVVPEQDQQLRVENVHDSLSMFREASVRQMRLEMLLEQNLATLPHKKSKSYSDAALGQLETARLEKDELIIDAASVENGEAFWSEEIQTQSDAIGNEAVFDAFITPFFSNVLHSCGMIFVNSERYQWLSQSTLVTKNTDLKPDGFATHRGMFRGKPVPNDGVQRPNGFRFGVAEEELFDCLILFESKLTITEAAFGQVVRYLQNLCPEASASAILFDRRSFWLIKSYKSVVVKVHKAMWVNKGSKSLFQNFITDNMSPWVARLTLACSCLGVDVVEGDAFLGRGAHGRVFKVIGQDRKVFALKIVEKCSVGRLYQEEKALTTAQRTGLTISPVGTLIETPESAALLLSPVGKPLPRPTTRQEVRNLFGLLWQLHANGLVHGDPRVPNVILAEEKPLWIDLVEVMEASPILKRFDAEILTRSILSVSRTVLLDPALKQLIDNYGKSATRENLNHLAEELCSLVFPN
ncbi:Crinkler (CRN) [Phytophthora megakarya]|uniref:Crinkler (CRN) n=1 Tax=Phytophthora megakarya TaxID=4795 RepID=A0A225WVB7_9STRA|nr:Crinkler (CRN) [Phytophthora megakarya]